MFLLAIVSVSPSLPSWRMVFMIAQVFLLFATVFLHWFLTTFSNCHLHTANQVTGPGGLSALVGCPRTRITSYCSRGFEQINPCFILPEICNWCLGMRCLKLWIVWWVCQSLISLDFWWASNPQGALARQFPLAKNEFPTTDLQSIVCQRDQLQAEVRLARGFISERDADILRVRAINDQVISLIYSIFYFFSYLGFLC